MPLRGVLSTGRLGVMEERLAALLAASPGHRDALQALALAGPRGAWIGAGFVRNAVWDGMAGRTPDVGTLADLDVVHQAAPPAPPHDGPPDLTLAETIMRRRDGETTAAGWRDSVLRALKADDLRHAAALRAVRPRLTWSVANQHRMALRAGLPPWPDLAAALAAWPETATAVAVRLAGGRIEVLAPHGLDDLFAGILRPTPAHAATPQAVSARAAAKGWRARWPFLRVIGVGPG